MPTDEQPSTHFYGYYISFDATGVEPVDHVLKAVADAGRGSHHTEYWKELGLEDEVQRAAERAAQAFRSREDEVQALKEALRKIAWLDTGENSSHSDALDALTKIEIIAFAALRGEGGDSE